MRRSGRTTRIVDDAIQELFQDKSVFIVDHHGTAESSYNATYIFMKRLKIEHGITANDLSTKRVGLGIRIELKEKT